MLNLNFKIMKRTNLLLAASLVVFAIIFTSCKKDETTPTTTTDSMVESTQDDDQVTSLYDDVLNESDEVALSGGGALKAPAEFEMLSGSGSRTVETTFDGDWTVKTVTFVDFINGNSGNGRVKNGKIIIRILGGPLKAQFERIITFDNFTIDSIKIEGEKHVTKIADYQYSVVLTGGKVTFTDGTTYTRELTRTRTWAEGYNTPANIWDDIFTITGSATGVNRKGYTYTHTITNALVIKNACHWIVEGTIEMVANGKTAILDYGDGTCDNLATVTVNGKTTEIKLRGKR